MATRVVILGGGVAGMSAAHELIERGLEVVVLERRGIPGGKARSIQVVHDGSGGSGHELAGDVAGPVCHRVPGEHGFRFFPGFYKHVIDTMRRIPSVDGRAVADHLVPTTRIGITQYGKPTFIIPAIFPTKPSDAATVLRNILLAFGPTDELTPDELGFFGARIWQILTSCEQRRSTEYEQTSWWEFIDAEARSKSYHKFLADGITRSLVAAKARKASTRTIGDIFVQLMVTILSPTAEPSDRVFDGPTNFVWIDPWLSYLTSRGVEYETEAEVDEILCDGKRITGVAVNRKGKRSVVVGDHYIAAVPIERIAPLLNQAILAADPSLAHLRTLANNVDWMNGLQFYLRRDLPTAHGHVIHIDSEWALTSISQLQFWRGVSAAQFADPEVNGVLSVDISDWTAPGSTGRPAAQCSRAEVMRETWKQMKCGINVDQELLRDEDVHSWFLDPDIELDSKHTGYLQNLEPLLVNLVGTWAIRPEATTGITNLFLASDYVRTHTDLATMEGANEAARRAVNGLLDAVEFQGARCTLWPLHEPEILAPWRLYDETRYKAGLPWDPALMQVAAHAIRGASPILEQARPVLEQVAPFIKGAADAIDAAEGTSEDPSGFRILERTGEPGTINQPIPAIAVGKTDAAPEADAGPEGFLERLGWYSGLVSDTLAAGVPAWEPQQHLYGLVRHYIDQSGKGLRPALCIATARALGGRTEDALPAAAGLEMLHNAFLVHDDIEDGSDWRRGIPTMHRRVGVPIAINTGDSMNALGIRLLRESGERLGPVAALRILDEVDHLVTETLEGQAMELGWVRSNDLTVGADDYLRLVLKKTAWYSFIHPMRIGALVANAQDPDLDRFNRVGYLLGLAFQITDDVLNLDGNVGRYGKEINGDLWEGKRTLILTHALAHANRADRAWMSSFLGRPRERRLPREVLRLRQIIDRAGSLETARNSAAALAQAAAGEFTSSAFAGVPASADLKWLRDCIDFLVQRDA